MGNEPFTENVEDGTVFAEGVGPAKNYPEKSSSLESLAQAIANLPHEKPFVDPKVTKQGYPEYMEEEHAEELFNEELSSGSELSPLSFIYYLSRDSEGRHSKEDNDFKGAIEEQGKIFKLFSSKEKLSPIEWETSLQNLSGWKEIKDAIGEEDFFRKTARYLTIKGIIAKLNNDKKLSDTLLKTATLLKNNLNRNTNGA